MKEILLDIRKKLIDNAYVNEEHVRMSLVARVVMQLGWDLWNPREVNAEFIAVPHEDQTRVDVALFLNTFSPSVFIEVKAVGKLEGNIAPIERQLRDYNRNNTALFSIITDGRQWRFYYSQTGGEFSQKCFKIVDLLEDDIDDIEMFFDAFLSKSEISTGNAKRDAENYLRLNQKQRAMEDALPKARRLVLEPPFPSLPHALIQLAKAAGFSVTIEEASEFIKKSSIEVEVGPTSVSEEEVKYKRESWKNAPPVKGPQKEPGYIIRYRAQLNNPGSLPSKMNKYIEDSGVVTWGDLRRACVEKLGCKSETSGSIGASLRLLEIDESVRIEGKGDSKRIFSLRFRK
jgi:hypothetical protein